MWITINGNPWMSCMHTLATCGQPLMTCYKPKLMQVTKQQQWYWRWGTDGMNLYTYRHSFAIVLIGWLSVPPVKLGMLVSSKEINLNNDATTRALFVTGNTDWVDKTMHTSRQVVAINLLTLQPLNLVQGMIESHQHHARDYVSTFISYSC